MAVGDNKGVIFGRYEVLRELGANGAGTLHLGRDRDDGRRVAIEILDRRLAADPAFLSRLRAIAKLLSQRRHPHIARLDEAGESSDGCPYLVMELVEGRPLTDLIAEQAPLSADDGIPILLQLALGVQHLHDLEIVPLQLRPDDVLIDSHGHVTLMPSSFFPSPVVLPSPAAAPSPARAAPTELENVSSAATLYQAPEEIGGEPAGQAADVYRLGLIAYELFTGRRPFAGTGQALSEEQLYASPPPLVRFNPGLPGPLARAIQRSLAKKPEARPSSTAAFADLLLGAEPEPQAAAPISEPVARADPRIHPAEIHTDSVGPDLHVHPAQTPDDSVGADLRVRPAQAAAEMQQEPSLAPQAGVVNVAPARSRSGRGRMRWLAFGIILAAVVAAAILVTPRTHRRTGSPAGATSPVASAAPGISMLSVCSDVFACKQTNFVAGTSLAVCFMLTPLPGKPALTAVITAAGSRPAGTNAPGVIARSAPISELQHRMCYQIVLSGPLPPGPYTAWVLNGASVLGQRDFATIVP